MLGQKMFKLATKCDLRKLSKRTWPILVVINNIIIIIRFNRLLNVWRMFKIDYIEYILSRSGYGKSIIRCGRVFARYSHLEYLVQGPLGRKKII